MIHERLIAFSRSDVGRALSARWDETYESAMREHPEPFANGFYNPDTKATARRLAHAKAFFDRIPLEAWESGRIELDWQPAKDRPFLLSLLSSLGITHAKGARSTTLFGVLKAHSTRKD